MGEEKFEGDAGPGALEEEFIGKIRVGACLREEIIRNSVGLAFQYSGSHTSKRRDIVFDVSPNKRVRGGLVLKDISVTVLLEIP